MKAFITGGAGFIGSNLADRLLADGHQVTIYDNFVTGQEAFVAHLRQNPNVSIIEADVLDTDTLTQGMVGADIVFHFQANADVRGGINNTLIDFEQNIVGSRNVLEAIRINGIKKVAFASSATVYGEPEQIPTPENIQLIQTSLYGASKASAENLIQAYCEYYGIRSFIFRFVSFIGPRYTHGVVFDFMKKLKENPSELLILGDGSQRKSYLHVHDGVNAIITAVEKATDKVNIFNLGNTEYMNVIDLANIVCTEMGLPNVQYTYSGGKRGWVGDTPFVHLDIKKISNLGWKPNHPIAGAIADTVRYLKENPQLFEFRN